MRLIAETLHRVIGWMTYNCLTWTVSDRCFFARNSVFKNIDKEFTDIDKPNIKNSSMVSPNILESKVN